MSAAVAGASAGERPQPDGEPSAKGITKQEKDSDIKDYAETTMNELLGWYGYDKLDTRGLNLKTLNRRHQFNASSSSSSSPTRHDDDASEEDTGQSTSPAAEGESIPPNTSGGTTIICAWCLKMGLKLFTLKTSSGEIKEFCSEPCFNQCRRAAFKKNRVCNWCRHVRHTVNYVDFQDGDDQLQFCSDKCLNQYKMQIFCKETQAYLQMNPHLQEEASKNSGTSKLITPDLWMRDCHEATNGGMDHSGDEEQTTKPKDKNELEDLSLNSKPDQNSLPNKLFVHDRDIQKNASVLTKDNSSERCNTLTSYLGDDKDKIDRKKRHNEMIRESARKRQRMSFRNKLSHPTEAPPAHLSSKHSSLAYPNQSSIFTPTTSFTAPVKSKSPILINPPAAHSKSFNPHPGIASSVIHPGLPPPPPLLSNDFYPPSFNPPVFSPQPQNLDAILRMQAALPPNAYPPNYFPEHLMPLVRNPAASNITSLPHPNTVMLPYPIFVPFPIPIPIPLPLKSFLPKDKTEGPATETANKNVESELVNNSKSITANHTTLNAFNSKNQETFSTNSDTDELKLLKKTKKR